MRKMKISIEFNNLHPIQQRIEKVGTPVAMR